MVICTSFMVYAMGMQQVQMQNNEVGSQAKQFLINNLSWQFIDISFHIFTEMSLQTR
jgi:hypothetical protein